MPLKNGGNKPKKTSKTPKSRSIKESSVSKLKRKLWKLVSEYVRRRSADWRGYASCVTCGVAKPWKELQAGHFIPGRHNGILFELKGIHPQCYRCNIPLKSNPRAYDKYMRENYGEEVIKELEEIDKQNKQFTTQELLQKIDEFNKLILTL